MGRRATWAVAAAAAAAVVAAAAAHVAAAAEVALGSLSTIQHAVSGDVVAINARTLEVRNFAYDGLGPAAFFWAGTGTPSSDGVKVREVPGCAGAALPAGDGTTTVRLELPADMDVTKIDYLSVWCETFRVDFGNVVFGDRHAAIDAAVGEAPATGYECFDAPAAVAPVVERAPVSLGSLSTIQHDVEGEVFAINARTLEVRNFRYDGLGPAAFFWAGTGTPSSDGVKVREVPGCAGAALPAGDGTTTVRLELPADMDVTKIDYLSVWCETFRVDFGNVVFGDRHAAIDAAVGDAPPGGYTCFEDASGGGGGGSPAATPDPLPNCVTLNARLQVRWVVNGTNVRFALIGRMTPDEWAGFGVSGADDSTRMVGSDVTIASVDDAGVPTVHDFHLSAESACNANGAGVCPDTDSLGANGTDDVSAITGGRDNDVATVRFSRPVSPTDVAPPGLDRPLPVGAGVRVAVSWALGPLDEGTRLPRFHSSLADYPSGGRDTFLELGRTPADECDSALVPTAGGAPAAEVTAWSRPAITDTTDFNVVIGPSGGPHGYAAIHAGAAAWGIAYYINDLLVPVLVVERGKTYRFNTLTGDDPRVSASYHPVYISDSANGGFFLGSPAEQAAETVFAGITRLANGTFTPEVESPICTLSITADTDPEADFPDYFKTLSNSCEASTPEPGVLSWTVAEDTPDTVYYGCTDHRNLGFRIAVFDEGAADPAVYNNLIADSPIFRVETAEEAGPACELSFGGTTRTFGACTTLSDRIELFWTLDEEAETADMALRSLSPAGYVSVGWPETATKMVPGDAVVVHAAGGTPTVAGYRLSGRNSPGVQPDADRLGLTAAQAEMADDGTLSAVFTRAYSPASGTPSLRRGPVDFIWAVGPSPSSPTSLAQHSFRTSGTVDLSLANGSASELGTSIGTFFAIHAGLMGVPWLFLIPAAILFARYFKGTSGSAWFQFHRAVNTLSVMAVVAALVMGLIRGTRTETTHFILGCIVVPLAVLQVVAGVFRPAKDATLRSAWYVAHSWAGRTAVILAWVNIFFGMRTARADAGKGWLIGVGAYLCVLTIIIVSLEVRKRKAPPREAV